MMTDKWSRRSVLAAIPGLAAGAADLARATGGQSVKWSSGSGRPKARMPAGAIDCHFHIYDARFPADPKAVLRPGDATVADYRQLQKRIGTSRGVIVQPSTYGVDNRLLTKSLEEFGPAVARGVAVVNTGVAEAEWKRLHASGVRGIRFNLVQAGATSLDMVEPLSRRAADQGWHIQIHALADQILAAQSLWDRVACPLVFDHLGHVPQPDGIRHPVFGMICRLLQKGKAWVKLSGLYYDTKVGPPGYADSVAVAGAYVREAPDRVVWGSDWPHPTMKDTEKPDDALLVDRLAECAHGEAVFRRILVDNAANLYGFA